MRKFDRESCAPFKPCSILLRAASFDAFGTGHANNQDKTQPDHCEDFFSFLDLLTGSSAERFFSPPCLPPPAFFAALLLVAGALAVATSAIRRSSWPRTYGGRVKTRSTLFSGSGLMRASNTSHTERGSCHALVDDWIRRWQTCGENMSSTCTYVHNRGADGR